MKNNMENKIFLENLPKKEGIGKLKGKQVIDWKSSIGYVVKGIHEGIEFEVKITDCEKRYLYIEYLNKKPFKILCDAFKNCKIGALMGTNTSEFKHKEGEVFRDEKRDITIIDMEYRRDDNSGQNWKWYKYVCNICGWTEGWILESNLNKGIGCSCCANYVVVHGINDIPTTAPWLIPYFQGGYDEAKLYTKTGSGNPNNKGGYIYALCPDCGRVKSNKKKISKIYYNHSIGCACSDNIPYGEKLAFSVLEQLGLDFKTQLTKATFKWCDKYKYDFYFELDEEKYIVETHGLQHYEDAWSKLEVTQENDRSKKQLALKNGIKEENYIVIDCRYSTLDWIKEHILEDITLNNIFNLNIINWLKADEFTLTNKIKEVCNYKKNNPNLSTVEIGESLGYSQATIYNWLKKGSEYNWCEYDANKEKEKRSKDNGRRNKERCSKFVEVFKNGISLGVFPSACELDRQSEELFGVHLSFKMISAVCLGKRKYHKGYTFKFVEQELNEAI